MRIMKPEAIITFRKSRKISQSELARELGVDQATVSRAENGAALPRPAALLLRRLMVDAGIEVPEEAEAAA